MGTCSVSLSAQWMHLLSPTWITGAAAAGRWGDNLKCPWGEVTGMAESHVVPSISYKICLQGCTTVHSLRSLSKCLAAHQPLHLPPLSLSCLRWLRAVRLWILSESPGVALLSANKSNSGLGNHSWKQRIHNPGSSWGPWGSQPSSAQHWVQAHTVAIMEPVLVLLKVTRTFSPNAYKKMFWDSGRAGASRRF